MAPNALHDIVLPPSFANKLLSATGVSGPSRLSTNNLTGLRSNHSAVYFDLVGTLNAVLNNALLRPDGGFTLMEYRSDSSASKPGAALALTVAAAARLQVQRDVLPPNPEQPNNIPVTGALEDVVVELYLGFSATDATCSVAGAGAGKWMLVPRPSTVLPIPPRRGAGPRGMFAGGDVHPCPTLAAQISFVLPAGALLSSLKIGELELSMETHKPLQGLLRYDPERGGRKKITHVVPDFLRERDADVDLATGRSGRVVVRVDKSVGGHVAFEFASSSRVNG
ncbi:hypothetical protein H4582DRAFT_2063263 [Lactarius indigo]|nr:hypothetical protein H4582DRAFT_2063263 [Lactarius indigo]